MTIMLHTSEIFDTWLLNLADKRARARIDIRLLRIGMGLLGDVKPVGEGVSELRIDYGPGYRIYFAMRNNTKAVILIGGNKSSQKRDIARAKALWTEIKE